MNLGVNSTRSVLSVWILPDILVQKSLALTRVRERDDLFQEINVLWIDVLGVKVMQNLSGGLDTNIQARLYVLVI